MIQVGAVFEFSSRESDFCRDGSVPWSCAHELAGLTIRQGPRNQVFRDEFDLSTSD